MSLQAFLNCARIIGSIWVWLFVLFVESSSAQTIDSISPTTRDYSTLELEFDNRQQMLQEAARYNLHAPASRSKRAKPIPVVVVLSGFLHAGQHWAELASIPESTLEPLLDRKEAIAGFLGALPSVELSLIADRLKIVAAERVGDWDCVTSKGCYPKGFVIVADGLSPESAEVLCSMFNQNGYFCAIPEFAAHAPPDDVAMSAGRYIAVTARRNSGVAGGSEDAEAQKLIGTVAVFGDSLIWIDGTRCDDWQVVEAAAPVELSDPNLSDLAIGPIDGPMSSGDASLKRPAALFCDDEPIARMMVIDDRVLVVPSRSGLSNLVLERPLSQAQVTQLQTQLRSMKFYHGDATGKFDDATRRAVSAYAEYRGASYRFHRAAITANLLDGLGVLQLPTPPPRPAPTSAPDS